MISLALIFQQTVSIDETSVHELIRVFKHDVLDNDISI